jgi:serine-type D-Ala-D-Ala carboxypeptidase/endopeptidase (penicillin-binding protein 4)
MVSTRSPRPLPLGFISSIACLLLGLSAPLRAMAQEFPETSDRFTAETPGEQSKQAGGLCPAQASDAIGRIANRTAGRWGILIQTQAPVASRKTLVNRSGNQLLIPASSNKVLTTAAALTKLGSQYRIRTSVLGNSTGPSLTTLRIVGRGDPSLTTAKLNSLTQQLNRKGITQVAQLIGDDTYFRGQAINPFWDLEDTLAGYGAAVNSLTLNQNAIGLTLFPQRVGQPLRVQWDDPSDASSWQVSNQTVTVGAGEGESIDAVRESRQWRIILTGQLQAGSASEPVYVSVPNPGNYLVQKFRLALTRAKIGVAQSTLVSATPAPPGEVELATIDSPPLSDLIYETNQESNNLYAEALLKTLGRVQTPTSLNATESGVAAVKAILATLGVNSQGIATVDGSGLARRDRVSPEALVQTLQAMAQSPEAAAFRRSLPIAGVSGTLSNRFRNTAAQNRVFAKTGTLTGAVSLSGYATPPNYPPVVFSLIVNYSDGSVSTYRSAIDEMVLVLTRLRSC